MRRLSPAARNSTSRCASSRAISVPAAAAPAAARAMSASTRNSVGGLALLVRCTMRMTVSDDGHQCLGNWPRVRGTQP